MDLLVGSDGRGGGAPPRARLSTLCRCAAARCGLVRAWCGARWWPNAPPGAAIPARAATPPEKATHLPVGEAAKELR